MSMEKKGKGFMAIKIYHEKAYDRLRSPSIRDTLTEMSIPIHIIELIDVYHVS